MAKRKPTKIKLDDNVDVPMHDPHREEEKPEGWSYDEIDFYFNNALKSLNRDNYATASETVDQLVDQCLAEKNWSEGLTKFLQSVRAMNLEIETDQEFYRRMSGKLFEWRAMRWMIHSTGLGRYEDEIMKYEIAQKYAPPPPLLPPPRVVKEPVYVPRRQPKPSAPRKSVLNPEPTPRAPQAAKPAVAPAKPTKPTQPRINKPPASKK